MSLPETYPAIYYPSLSSCSLRERRIKLFRQNTLFFNNISYNYNIDLQKNQFCKIIFKVQKIVSSIKTVSYLNISSSDILYLYKLPDSLIFTNCQTFANVRSESCHFSNLHTITIGAIFRIRDSRIHWLRVLAARLKSGLLIVISRCRPG